jgi:MFS family permease
MNKSTFKTHPYAWCVLLLNSLFLFYKYVLQISPSVMTDSLMQKFHLTGAGLGNLAATYFYTFLFAQLLVGYLLDKYSARWLTGFAILMCSLGAWFFAASDTLFEAELARGLMGVGVAFATVSYMKQTSVWFPAKRLALVGGLLASAVGVGAVVGSAPVAYMVSHIGWKQTLHYVALAGFVLTALYVIFARDKNPLNNNLNNKNKAPLSWKQVKGVLTKKHNWLLTFYSGLAFSPLAVFSGLWGNPFLQEAYNLNATQAAGYITLSFVGLGLGAPLFGLLSDKLGHRVKVMASGTLLSLLALVMMVYGHTHSSLLLSTEMFLFGLGTGSFMLGFTLGKEWNSIAMTATVVAMINTGDALFGAFSEPFVGKLLDVFSFGSAHHGSHFALSDFHKAFLVLPVYLLLALVFAFYLNKVKNKNLQEESNNKKQDKLKLAAA